MPKKVSKKSAPADEAISFEDALGELEQITRNLESGQLSLDESIRIYERGMELRKICQQKLDEADKRLEYLKRREDGSLQKAPIQIADSEIDNSGQNRLFQQ